MISRCFNCSDPVTDDALYCQKCNDLREIGQLKSDQPIPGTASVPSFQYINTNANFSKTIWKVGAILFILAVTYWVAIGYSQNQENTDQEQPAYANNQKIIENVPGDGGGSMADRIRERVNENMARGRATWPASSTPRISNNPTQDEIIRYQVHKSLSLR